MLVILNKDVKGTGKAGDVVNVSDGFARNMLLPKGLATEATKGNVRHLEKQKEIAAEKKAAEKAAAVEQAEKIKELSVVIKTKAGDGGKIFCRVGHTGDQGDARDKRNARCGQCAVVF